MKKLLFFCFLFIKASVWGWWDSAHMAVAEIAQDHLNERTKKEVHALLSVLPFDDDMVSCASWADEIADNGLTGFSRHGIFYPYDPNNTLSQKDKLMIVQFLGSDNGIIGAEKCIRVLKDPNAPKWQKSVMLRLLIHYIGDLHMPLHCASLYNENFPQGDFGGCRFILKNSPICKKHLHGLWDSCMGYIPRPMSSPLNDIDRQFIHQFAQDIYANSFSDENIYQFNPSVWAEESYNIAISHAYKGIRPNEEIPKEYLEKNHKIAFQRIYIAGRRLSLLLEDLFSSNGDY